MAGGVAGAKRRRAPRGNARKEKRKYKHITWREVGRQAGWIVQWKGRTHGGFHSSQDAARDTLQAVMGLSSADAVPRVQRPASAPSRATSRYAGVYYHKQKGRYTTRDTSHGTFSTPRDAVRVTGAPLKRGLKPAELIRRVKFMRQVRHVSAGDLGPAFANPLVCTKVSYIGGGSCPNKCLHQSMYSHTTRCAKAPRMPLALACPPRSTTKGSYKQMSRICSLERRSSKRWQVRSLRWSPS